jgi:hypothetical protein
MKAPAFELEPVTLPIDKILPTRQLSADLKASNRYQVVAVSIAAVGVIEPPVVYPSKNPKGSYLMLDGHVRLEALKATGATQITCLVATDDESYTYNKKVNRLAPIQAHKMINRALDAGVSAEKIGGALYLSPETILSRKSMLANICPEAIDLLKDKPIGEAALRFFKWVTPMRQIDMAELMSSSGVYTGAYAKALATMSPREQLVNPEVIEKKAPKPEELAKIEGELLTLEKDFRMLDQSFGRDALNLTLVRGFLK